MKNIGYLNFTLIASLALSGCQSPEDVAVEACSNSIKRDLKAPSTFQMVDKESNYFPADPLGSDDKSSKYEYLQVIISYDAENSYGAPLRSKHRCTFLLKNNEIQDPHTLVMQGLVNENTNALMCLNKTKEAQTTDSPLVCVAPAELKEECCLPSEHYKAHTGDILWK